LDGHDGYELCHLLGGKESCFECGSKHAGKHQGKAATPDFPDGTPQDIIDFAILANKLGHMPSGPNPNLPSATATTKNKTTNAATTKTPASSTSSTSSSRSTSNSTASAQKGTATATDTANSSPSAATSSASTAINSGNSSSADGVTPQSLEKTWTAQDATDVASRAADATDILDGPVIQMITAAAYSGVTIGPMMENLRRKRNKEFLSTEKEMDKFNEQDAIVANYIAIEQAKITTATKNIATANNNHQLFIDNARPALELRRQTTATLRDSAQRSFVYMTENFYGIEKVYAVLEREQHVVKEYVPGITRGVEHLIAVYKESLSELHVTIMQCGDFLLRFQKAEGYISSPAPITAEEQPATAITT
jgi:hypothetical protein